MVCRTRLTRVATLLGIVVGLIALVRVVNILIVLVLPLYGIHTLADAKERCGLMLAQWRSLLIVTTVAVGVFFPQLAVWKYSTGSWLVNSYGSEGIPYWRSPHVLLVLFSVKKGLFFYSPLLFLAVVGFLPMRRTLPGFWAPTLLFCLLNCYVISSALIWWAGPASPPVLCRKLECPVPAVGFPLCGREEPACRDLLDVAGACAWPLEPLPDEAVLHAGDFLLRIGSASPV